MVKDRINKNDKLNLFFVFLIAFLPRIYYCLQMVPVRTIGDEIATISTGAYFSGLDWSAIMSVANYYGGGFSIFLAPLFKITDNPYIIYRTALILAAVLQSLVAPISYHLMERYFNVKSRAFLLIASISSSFMVVTRSNIVYNEHMLILLVWILAWLLCILYCCEEKKKKVKYTVLLMLCLSYALTVHIRAYTLWIAIVIVIIYYFIVSKKWLVSKLTFVIGGIAGYLLSNLFIQYIQSNIWLAEEDDTLTNSVIQISTRANILDLSVFKTWLNIIFGQIYSIGIYSGIILLVALIIFLPMIFRVLFIKKERCSQKNLLYIILPLTFMMCIAMTIVAQSISWLSSAITASEGGYEYGFKAYTYIRYFGPYCGPVFMAVLVYINEHYREARKIMLGTIACFMILQVYWIAFIVSDLDGVTVASEIYVEFVNGIYGRYKDILMYLVPSCIVLAIYLCVMFLFQKRKSRGAVFILCGFLIWEYGAGSVAIDIPTSKSRSEEVLAGYQLIKDIEEREGEISDVIYAVDERPWENVRGQRNYYLYQFYLNHYTIIPDYPEEDCDEAIVFCNEICDELIQRGYTMYQLDDNEFIYAFGENYISLIESTFEK